MPIRVFTVRYKPELGRFDDGEMVAALEGCRVVSLSDHAFVVEGLPVVAVTVRWEAPRAVRGSTGPGSAPRSRPEAALAEEDRQLFEALRSWRNARARKDGRPAYVLFSNSQLAEIASRRPQSKAELGEVEGVGPGRVEGYAEDVLAVVAGVPRGAGPAKGDGTDGG